MGIWISKGSLFLAKICESRAFEESSLTIEPILLEYKLSENNLKIFGLFLNDNLVELSRFVSTFDAVLSNIISHPPLILLLQFIKNFINKINRPVR